MHSILRKSLVAVALLAMAMALGALATPVLAKGLGADLGSSAGISLGSGGALGVGAGLAAGAESGGIGVTAGADGQIATPAPLNLQPAAPVPAGLDRFSIQSNGPANLSIFYRVLKTKF